MEPDTSQSPVAVSRDVSRYSLSVEEVVLLFVEAELPRSHRSIQRACKRGHFDAILGDTECGQRYFITPESVDRRINELKQIESQHTNVAASRDASRHAATDRDSSRHVASPGNSNEDEELSGNEEDKKKIKDLQNEVMHLKIENKAKEQVINFMTEDRKEFWNHLEKSVDEVRQLSATVGQLQTQLQLSAPADPEIEEAEVIAHLEESSNPEDFYPAEPAREETEHNHSQPVDQSHPFEVK